MAQNPIICSVWDVEQDILDVFHAVCTQNHLRYSLGYGTLIGAVRHGGFIPWDDDIDVMMPREDYDKLLLLWDSVAPEGYLIQNHHKSPEYPNNFSKIVKDHTTFLQDEWARKRNFHKGFFIDIFPADRVAPGFISRKLQFASCAINLLYSKNFRSGSGGLKAFIEVLLLSLPKKLRVKLRQSTENYIKSWSSRPDCPWFFPCTLQECGLHYPSTLFDHLGTISFRDKTYCCFENPDVPLKIQYGDYMTLPPEEERVWKHHPILIDFNRNYEEIEEKL